MISIRQNPGDGPEIHVCQGPLGMGAGSSGVGVWLERDPRGPHALVTVVARGVSEAMALAEPDEDGDHRVWGAVWQQGCCWPPLPVPRIPLQEALVVDRPAIRTSVRCPAPSAAASDSAQLVFRQLPVHAQTLHKQRHTARDGPGCCLSERSGKKPRSSRLCQGSVTHTGKAHGHTFDDDSVTSWKTRLAEGWVTLCRTQAV